MLRKHCKTNELRKKTLQCHPMFFKLEILKVKDIFTLQISKFIYKCLNPDTPDNFHDWCKLNCVTQPYNTRSNFIFIK